MTKYIFLDLMEYREYSKNPELVSYTFSELCEELAIWFDDKQFYELKTLDAINTQLEVHNDEDGTSFIALEII